MVGRAKSPEHRSLRRILIAQIPADFADWLDFIAIITLMTYVWQVDTIYFAWLAAAMSLPYIIIGPLAGTVVDRVDLRKTMVRANIGRAILTVGVALSGSILPMLALLFLRGAVDSFFTPAKQAAFQALATPDALMRTNSHSFLINQLSKIAGPAIGGLLLVVLAPTTIILCNAALSLIAALILLGLPGGLRPVADKDGSATPSLWADLGAGLRLVASLPAIWVTFLLAGAGYFALFLYDTLIGPMLNQLGQSPQVLGLSVAAVGGGGVIGALLLGRFGAKANPFGLIALAMLLVAPVVAALGLAALMGWAVPPAILIAGFLAAGIIGAGIFVPQRTLLQLHAPADHMARITALFEAATLLAVVSAPFIGAILADRYGLSTPFLLGAALLGLFGAVALWASRAMRNDK